MQRIDIGDRSVLMDRYGDLYKPIYVLQERVSVANS